MSKPARVLVTGGETFLGINITSALLAEGADVTVLVRPGAEERLGVLGQKARWYVADVWDTASLRGRARGHSTVIHTVGSMVADPAQGLSYHRLNVVSARNIANMCQSDGVSHLVLMSAVGAPWVNRQYVRAKREAEQYIGRIGLQGSIVRAPIVYVRGTPRPLFYRLMSLLGRVPPVSWLGMNRLAPMPLDVLARGVARIALQAKSPKIYYASDLRRLNKREELRGISALAMPAPSDSGGVGSPSSLPFDTVDDDTPFGWMP
jgi:uncharacterized protein YbjT (DUF2867 family)